MNAISPIRSGRPLLTAQEKLRHRMERAIEKLIAALDAMDGDADFEPALGSVATAAWMDQRFWSQGDDAEEQHDAEPDPHHACPNYELHDQRRQGTYAGDPLRSLDPDEVEPRIEVWMGRAA